MLKKLFYNFWLFFSFSILIRPILPLVKNANYPNGNQPIWAKASMLIIIVTLILLYVSYWKNYSAGKIGFIVVYSMSGLIILYTMLMEIFMGRFNFLTIATCAVVVFLSYLCTRAMIKELLTSKKLPIVKTDFNEKTILK